MWRVHGAKAARQIFNTANLIRWPSKSFTSQTTFETSTLLASESSTLYDLLGVPKSASAIEIKAAFLQRAKELHPDLRDSSATSTKLIERNTNTDAFVRLITAREVLGCPNRRALYDLELRTGFSHGESSSSTSSQRRRRQHDQGATSHDQKDQRDASHKHQMPEWLAEYNKSVTGSLWEKELREEYQEAMMKAFLGPQLDPTVWEEFPDCFEADERARAGDAELMHVVSGRTLLGVVTQREAANQLPPHQLPTGDFASANGSGRPAPMVSYELELEYGDCGVVMSSHKMLTTCPRSGFAKDCIVLHKDGELVYRVFGDFDNKHKTQRMYVYDARNRLTHLGQQHFTPMVTHLLWYSALTRRCVW
eukprot:CAMPEP_0114311150 /NCGR_PEP_ID=MMETSP0059-20121206/19659_1 /TAXON_ID=36894 /ORGANISM="Pyramimonas parkeae, Strain CCMP726" /LENGTH=364 /DNA_ID=CAMNT_0001435281 /DNA_START=290 /DNA_END=1381 /DNA_ORIENTATION=-